ncbi:MAG: methyltransferase domain-containing protein [Pseudomonadota bacterium]
MSYFIVFVAVVTLSVIFLHWLSYSFLKRRIVERDSWDLNICCGTTNGGGINADIFQHTELPNFVKLETIYQLPFSDNQFDTVLCSHTAEHVDDPDRFDQELRRVGKKVYYVLPPIWDLAAAFNIREHRWVFFCVRKIHSSLPKRMRLPFAKRLQARVGQKITA